jgi:RNA polymerase sigma-70 factor (ECF subfamily)
MQDNPATDEALMAAYAGGDVAAFEALYRRHEQRVWRYLQRQTGNRATADDLMQEVWFAVARDAANYQPTARFTTWLFTIAHHRVIDSVRARRREVALDTTELVADPAAGPLPTVEARDRSEALLAAVSRLPEEQRSALVLQLDADLPVEAIATVTGCSFETVKSRLRYARSRLRELLTEYA